MVRFGAMPKPSRRVFALLSLIYAFLVLLAIDEGDLAKAAQWTAIGVTVTFGLWWWNSGNPTN